MKNKLTVVGTGIKSFAHLTSEAKFEIENANKVFCIVSDPLTQLWIRELHKEVFVLNQFYSEEKDRFDTYNKMVEKVVDSLEEGSDVCLISYGHPGVFAYPMHEAIRRAKAKGFKAEMLPGISAEDCLFADIGVDPGVSGCQSFEATDFLVYKRKFDVTCSLVLWQIGVIAEQRYKKSSEIWNRKGIQILTNYLLNFFPSDHMVVIYEAAVYSISDPKMTYTKLAQLSISDISAISTLYVPPYGHAKADNDMLKLLKLTS